MGSRFGNRFYESLLIIFVSVVTTTTTNSTLPTFIGTSEFGSMMEDDQI